MSKDDYGYLWADTDQPSLGTMYKEVYDLYENWGKIVDKWGSEPIAVEDWGAYVETIKKYEKNLKAWKVSLL